MKLRKTINRKFNQNCIPNLLKKKYFLPKCNENKLYFEVLNYYHKMKNLFSFI